MAVTPAQHDKFFEEICSQNQNFFQYERNFQEVLMELEIDDILETFRREYESLHHSFVKCHEGEKRLIKKCLDLQVEANSCARKIKAAEELTVGDQNTIEQLEKEDAKTKERISLSKETKVALKEKIKNLKVEIKELEKQVSRGAAGIVPHDATINELSRVRRELQADLDTQKSHFVALEHEIETTEGRVNKIGKEKLAHDEELQNMRDENDKKKHDIDYQRQRKDRNERELIQMKEDLAKRNRQYKEGQTAVAALVFDIEKLDDQVQLGKENTDQGSRQLTALLRQMQEVHQQLHDCSTQTEQLRKEIVILTQQLKLKDSEVAGEHVEQVKHAKLVNAIEKRNIVVETQRTESEILFNSLKLKAQQREMAVSNMAKLLENDRKQLEDLARESDVLNKTYLKAHNSNQKQNDWLLEKENQKTDLGHQIKGYERHAQMQNEVIYQLSKEVEGYEKDGNEAALKYAKVTGENKTLDNLCAEEELKIHECESKIKRQRTILEVVLKERNVYSKNYNELRMEIGEMGRKFKILVNQIKQLKEEIQVKEKELVKEEAMVTSQTTLRKKHEIRIDAAKKKIEKRERTVEAYNTELHKLNQIIVEADVEKRHQQRDHTNVLNERDILGSQLLNRNNELAQLYEKIRIQQFQLRNGETLYSDRLRDIQQMELRISQLDEELMKMRDFASKLPELQLLINKTERELTREQCRVRGLLDECDNPQNVHRLHNLAWSEPQTYELHQKVHQLQKELVKKSNEVEAKNRLIQKKENLFVELKGVISRQPGPEVAEQLNIYQDTLQKKVGQMRNMKLSLQHFQEKVDNYKDRYEDLNEELTGMETDYYSTRRTQDREMRKQRIMNEMMARAPDAGTEEPPPEVAYEGYTAPPRPQTSDEMDASDNYPTGDEADIADVISRRIYDDNKEDLDDDNNEMHADVEETAYMPYITSVADEYSNSNVLDAALVIGAETEQVETPHADGALDAVGNGDSSEHQPVDDSHEEARETGDGEDQSGLNNDIQ